VLGDTVDGAILQAVIPGFGGKVLGSAALYFEFVIAGIVVNGME
jgi:hypothetical protein